VGLIYKRGQVEKLIRNTMTKFEFIADIIYEIGKITTFTK
jgi:hypothetical protein